MRCDAEKSATTVATATIIITTQNTLTRDEMEYRCHQSINVQILCRNKVCLCMLPMALHSILACEKHENGKNCCAVIMSLSDTTFNRFLVCFSSR